MSARAKRDLLKADELHLLRIDRTLSVDRTALTFQLEWYTRTSAPKYTAVSYTWGEQSAKRHILIDGYQTAVSVNVWWCLHSLFQYTDWQYVWVDAVCINQHDRLEKSGQVREMAATFRDAELVTAWLGQEREDEKGLSTASAISELVDGDDMDSACSWEDELEQLSCRRYWSRRWIIQELFHARRIEVACGPHRLSWKRFENLLDSTHLPAEKVQGPAIVRRTLKGQERLLNPLKTFVDLRHFACKDPRDRVFALISLFPAEYKKGIKVDYVRRISIVFKRFLTFLLRHEEHDEIGRQINRLEDAIGCEWTHSPQWYKQCLKNLILRGHDLGQPLREYAQLYLSAQDPEEWFRTPLATHKRAAAMYASAPRPVIDLLENIMHELVRIVGWFGRSYHHEEAYEMQQILDTTKPCKPDHKKISRPRFAGDPKGFAGDPPFLKLINRAVDWRMQWIREFDEGGLQEWTLDGLALRQARLGFCYKYGFSDKDMMQG